MGSWRKKKVSSTSTISDIEANGAELDAAVPNAAEPNTTSGHPLEQFQVEQASTRSRRRRCSFSPSISQQIRTIGSACAGMSCLFLIFVVVEGIFFLFNYYYMYPDVYPGSKPAQNLNGGGGVAFTIFWAVICCWSCLLTCPAGVYLIGAGIGGISEVLGPNFGPIVACLIAVPWTGLCLFLGTWQFWITWAVEPAWWVSVYNGGCKDWSGYALLQGPTYQNVQLMVPEMGTAAVILPTGNYTMQLDRSSYNPNTYYFYPIGQNNVDAFSQNITYNTFMNTYTINNQSSRYTTSPNLAFPSLDISLDDPSIPFGGDCDLPNANLVYRNGTTSAYVFNTVNTNYDDCSILKSCVNMEYQRDFEIAMGIVLLHQSRYGVCCTTPDSDDDD